jgi:hypothetical protein
MSGSPDRPKMPDTNSRRPRSQGWRLHLLLCTNVGRAIETTSRSDMEWCFLGRFIVVRSDYRHAISAAWQIGRPRAVRRAGGNLLQTLLDYLLQSVWIDANHRQYTFSTRFLSRHQRRACRDHRVGCDPQHG